MLRRHILKLTAGTAVGAVAVRVLAFGDEKGLPKLDRRFDEASRAGRPLLVFVVPDDPTHRYSSGTVFGAYLNGASDEDLAPLALVDAVCGRAADVKSIAPAATLGDDPLLILLRPRVEGADVAVSVLAIEREEGDSNPLRYASGKSFEQIVAETKARIEQRNAKIASFLASELGAERVKELAALVRQKLPAEQVAKLDAPVLDVASLGTSALRAGAAILLERVSGSTGKDRAQVVPALATTVRESVVTVPPAGAKWAISSGCGTTIEGEEDELRVACGMGFVPPQEQRFLMFLGASE